jgi:hypothetical protein
MIYVLSFVVLLCAFRAFSKIMTGYTERRLQFLFVTDGRDARAAPTLITTVSKQPLLAKIVTATRLRRSLLMVWMRS